MLVSNQISPSTPVTNYIANFTTQHLLTMNWGPGGGVAPGSGCKQRRDARADHTATPAPGLTFTGSRRHGRLLGLQ